MDQLLQVLANGFVIGGTYALMAVGLTLIFGYMDLVNFAHGELYMLGGFAAYTFIVMAGLPFVLGFPLAILAVVAFGYVLDRVILKPLRGRGVMVGILTTIGLAIILQNAALLIWNPVPKRLPVPIEASAVQLGTVRLAPVQLLAALLALAIIALAGLFMRRTRLGMAVRATFQDPEAAGLMGISVDRIYGGTFAGGAGLAAAGGALLGMVFLITPTMGEVAVLKAFTVVILGGLGNFLGAAVGGLLVGTVESAAATYISAGYKDAIAFVLLILVLVARPQGILGRAPAVEQT
ncbi:MAG: branched-chain amino acid ABC transporter permease [Egibacteraceae bacterium]